MKNETMVLEVLKETQAFLQGHFLLSSGRHSNAYCQMARLLQYPDKASKVLQTLADQLKEKQIDVVVGPAIGGIIVAYELGRLMGKKAIFTERENNIMTLRRGFEIKKGERCIIAEDVITTGKSSQETAKIIEEMGGIVVGIASIVDRTTQPAFCDVYSAIQLNLANYEAADCPICKEEVIELIKPGSRKISV